MNIKFGKKDGFHLVEMFSVFKSAVAFFFLFFLHEISIENGHKGISYNVIQLRARFCFSQNWRVGGVTGCGFHKC